MPREGGDIAYLWDMRDSAQRLLRIMSSVTHGQFEEDDVLRLAAERLLQNIGEGARRVSPEFREGHPEIPWHKMIGQRNILVHEYGDVNRELIWLTITDDLDDLVRRIEPLIPAADDE